MKLIVAIAALFLLTGCEGMVVLDGHYDHRGYYSYQPHHRHYYNYYTPHRTYYSRLEYTRHKHRVPGKRREHKDK